MSHNYSVFKNSCLKVPVDPINKMPKTAYERKPKPSNDPSLDSPSTVGSIAAPDVEAEKLKDFYRSIPDYNDINHLTEEEFYSTLKSLRERKRLMLGIAVEHIDSNGLPDTSIAIDTTLAKIDANGISCRDKITKSKLNYTLRNNYSEEKKDVEKPIYDDIDDTNATFICTNKIKMKRCPTKTNVKHKDSNGIDELKVTPVKTSLIKNKNKLDRPKRNHSACSISWNDGKLEGKDEIDEKFEQYFDGKKYSPTCIEIDEEFKTRSMPSSPLRMRRNRNISPSRSRKIVTIPKPFKMTERDEEDRIVSELRSLRKSFSEDMLDQKYKRKQFRARPVPIESRIPLYDKILEDQAMRFTSSMQALHVCFLLDHFIICNKILSPIRRAITKINSEADLRAQMKPFSFTKREEKGGVCERAVHALPKNKKKKRFKARPVPKNLFSNYFFDKIKEDEFFRSMNRRIRAEELLRASTYPGSMAARERSRLSTPAAHSDLPIDPSPAVPSTASTERPTSPTKNRHRSSSPTKCQRKRDKFVKEDLITTSPQPFRFNTADRAAKKMQDLTNKIYQDSKCTESGSGTGGAPGARAYSALDLRAAASGRSNLAALLRAEAVRRKFEMESARRLADQRRRMEMKQRDRLLRSKPAWHLVKNNHEEDIALRLQTRRDEERMRREEFLHEMELMYGRVHDQPMLFERYYAPRPYAVPVDSIRISPRKSPKKRSSCKSHHYTSPIRSRKVSINDTAETFNGDLSEYLNKIDDDKLYSDSEVAIDSLEGGKL